MNKWSPKEEAMVKPFARQRLTAIEAAYKLQDAGLQRSRKAIGHKLVEYGWKDPRGEEMVKQIEQLRPQRIGYLDIESTGLNATFGQLLTWCVKEKGKNVIHCDTITRKEIMGYKADQRILKSLADCLFTFDKVYSYYGGDWHFDVPMVRTRCIKFGIKFPTYGQLDHVDLYKDCKKKLRLHSHRLAVITEFFGIDGKTRIDPAIWQKASLGHVPSLKNIMHHNKMDVEILEKLHDKVQRYTLESKTSI